MRVHRSLLSFLLILGGLALLASPAESARRRPSNHEPVGFQLFTSPQSNPVALSADGSRLYVANTTSGTVDVIDTALEEVIRTVEVGLDPVSVAVRPDQAELWVSNHVSDSLSVIDIATGSPTEFQVIATVQELDANGSTLFDEPVGLAFSEDGTKAYVALSSRNEIGVVNTSTRAVTKHVAVSAQEPRAIAVRNGRLYVAAFESGNQSELSACPTAAGGMSGSAPQCTLGALAILAFATNPNLPGAVRNIVTDPQVPDRDLFVFNTTNEAAVGTPVSGIGTLLYGLAVDGSGNVFITQTDARNAVNGLDAGTNLIDLDNRMFTNEIAMVDCTGASCSFSAGSDLIDLDPAFPDPGTALSQPFGIAVSGNNATLVATASGTSRVFTMNATTGAILDILDLGALSTAGRQMPRGIALRSNGSGAPLTAYVLNTLENTVSVVDVSNPASLDEGTEIPVGDDPVPNPVRRGRIAFSNAFASTSGTFSCESCHPDGNTDQLLWRIGGKCLFGACDEEDEPRTTMPVRGLKNTIPLHWDGSLGDPFGGPNGATGDSGTPPFPAPSCSLVAGDHACFLDLVMGSLSGVMCDQSGSCPPGGNELSAQERDDMATFLASVSYPPARSRRVDDTTSTGANGARTGFSDFFTNQGGIAGDPDTCADSTAGCHELPLGAATNSDTLNGFDVPTMRGMTDRFLQFSLGITNPEEVLVLANAGAPLFGVSALEASIRWEPATIGFREITTFGSAFFIFQPVYGMRPIPTFQMFEEASTGFSGATGRQLTLNTTTALLAGTIDLMSDLENSDLNGLVNLRAAGLYNGSATTFSFRSDGTYKDTANMISRTPSQLRSDASAGTALVTLTAALRQNVGDLNALPQPLIAPNGSDGGPNTGDPDLPSSDPMTIRGISVRSGPSLFVDGALAGGSVSCSGGTFSPFCTSGIIVVDLSTTPSNGLHLLQVQNPAGLLSNELPICFGPAAGCTGTQ